MHTYILTYIHTYIHTYVRTYIRTYIHTYTRKGDLAGGSPSLKSARKLAALETGNFIIYVKQVFALLGCYAAFVDSYRRLGTACRSHLQESGLL